MDIATSHIAEARNKRMPGARRLQILQTLAAMLEDPKGEKVTTAALAAKLNVSEATIKAHVSAILQKLGVDSRTQAVIAIGKLEPGNWQRAGDGGI